MAVALELLTGPPAEQASDTPPMLDPDAIEFIGETDTLLTMCSCSASESTPY
jgi:hypothetical protein